MILYCCWTVNRNFRSGRVASLLIFLCVTFSGTAWIRPVPFTHADSRYLNHLGPSPQCVSPLRHEAKKQEMEDSQPEPGKPSGFFSRFTNSESDKDKEKQAKAKEEEESGGFFRSITKKLENRKESRDAKNKVLQEAKLAEILENERRKSGMASYVPKFNTSSVVSALRDWSTGFTQAQDEIRNIRPAKVMLSEEEKILEELRKRTAAEKRRRLIAQQVADQRSQQRRQKKALEEIEAKKAKEGKDERRKGDQGASQETSTVDKRSNPLSVAQKYVSSFFESQNNKEEWLVVAPKTRISPGEMVPITTAGLDLLLVASKDGSALYCIANSCPHLGTPLEVGTLERRPIETTITSNSTSSSIIDPTLLRETDIANLLTQDGCEDCIVCPLHRTAFALGSGEVRGEWCPYPPVIGKVMGTVKSKSTLPVFDVRTRGKNIEVRLNTPLKMEENED